MTPGKITKICATCPIKDSIVVKETIRVERHDSTVYVTQEGPVIFLPHPCATLCDSFGHLKRFDYVKKTGGLKTELKSQGDSLIETCNADSLKEVIRGLNIERIVTKESFEEKFRMVVCMKEHRTGWDYFCHYVTWFFLVCVVLLLIGVYLHFRFHKL